MAEEQYYLQQYQRGDMEAKNILIERNLRLVAHVDELSAAHLCVDDFAGEERPHQQVFWPVRPRTL